MIYVIDRFFSRMTGRQLVLWSLVQVLFIGLLDWITGSELSFAVFYLVPVSVAAWYSGTVVTYGIVLAAAGTWLGVEYVADRSYSAQWILYWNSAVRLVFFSVVALLIHQLRSHVELQQRLARTDHRHDGRILISPVERTVPVDPREAGASANSDGGRSRES